MRNRLILLSAVLLVTAAAYMLIDAKGPGSFIFPYRATKLAALVLVGAALSVATVLFQTITGNRILTPSLMGFDALYVMILSVLVFGLGTSGYAALPQWQLFAINVAAMSVLGLLLFVLLMRLAQGDMVRMVLTGVMVGLLIRSLTEFVQRLIDPTDFQMVQSMSFARFTQIDRLLLAISAVAIAIGIAGAWALRHRLDVLSLGDTASTSLGEPPRTLQRLALLLICLLVAASTSLAGPLAAGGFGPSSFFGLVVVAFAHIVTPTYRHAILLPAAGLMGGVFLVGGQLIMERIFDLSTPLMVVIELIGGATFLFILLKRRAV